VTAVRADDPGLTEAQDAVREDVSAGMLKFPRGYWREHDRLGEFPHEFFDFAAQQGWLGLVMPVEYGGAGLGISCGIVLLEGVARVGGLSATSAIHMNVFGLNVVAKHGHDEMRAAIIPEVIAGRRKVAFAVTEPDSGLDTSSIRTRGTYRDGKWHVNGRKVWISTAQIADKILILARTAEPRPGKSKLDGLTLFFTDLDRSRIDVREIRKAGRAAVDSNELFIDDLVVDEADVVGRPGDGFKLLLDGLNPERLLVASEAVGIGRGALDIAVDYARSREVFGRPIGANQGVQFPLADSHARLHAAWLTVVEGARKYDSGQSCGADANIAKYLGAEAGFQAADRAMQALGGYGYAAEYDVERLWREVKLCRIAPVTPELILAFLAEKELGLPRSY
jgi:acyl-CoA dehydrogenase